MLIQPFINPASRGRKPPVEFSPGGFRARFASNAKTLKFFGFRLGNFLDYLSRRHGPGSALEARVFKVAIAHAVSPPATQQRRTEKAHGRQWYKQPTHSQSFPNKTPAAFQLGPAVCVNVNAGKVGRRRGLGCLLQKPLLSSSAEAWDLDKFSPMVENLIKSEFHLPLLAASRSQRGFRGGMTSANAKPGTLIR